MSLVKTYMNKKGELVYGIRHGDIVDCNLLSSSKKGVDSIHLFTRDYTRSFELSDRTIIHVGLWVGFLHDGVFFIPSKAMKVLHGLEK